MTVHWTRVAALLIAVTAIVLTLTCWEQLVRLFGSVRHLRSEHATRDEFAQGLIAAALIVIAVIGVVRLLRDDS